MVVAERRARAYRDLALAPTGVRVESAVDGSHGAIGMLATCAYIVTTHVRLALELA